MLKKVVTLAVLSAFALAAAPGIAQNQNPGGQSSQDQMTPGNPGDNTGTQAPHHKKKKRHSGQTGQSNSNTSGQSDSTHPGNSNQTDVPSTQPGGQGTQSGQNPAGPPSTSNSNSSGTSR